MSDARPSLFDEPTTTAALAADVAQPVPGAARRGDPETSKRAARNVMPRTGQSRAQVLAAFDQNPNGFTDDALAEFLGDRRGSRWRTARHELATLYDDPLLHHVAGEERPTRGGQAARVWRITERGAQIAGALELEAFAEHG